MFRQRCSHIQLCFQAHGRSPPMDKRQNAMSSTKGKQKRIKRKFPSGERAFSCVERRIYPVKKPEKAGTRDNHNLWIALRYTELNPVRTGAATGSVAVVQRLRALRVRQPRPVPGVRNVEQALVQGKLATTTWRLLRRRPNWPRFASRRTPVVRWVHRSSFNPWKK